MLGQTNEELAVLIQYGREDLYEELWERVEKFIRLMAGRFWVRVKANGYPAFEPDDLIQSGFFSLVKAAKYYEPERGYSFLTYLGKALKSDFADIAGSRRGKADAMHRSISLDETVAIKDSEQTVADMIADPEAEEAIIRIADRAGMRYAEIVCRRALHSLKPQERAFLYARYYLDMSVKDASEAAGIPLSTGKSFDLNLSAKLRSGRYGNQLRQCWELIGRTNPEHDPLSIAYSGGGWRFKNTSTSTTEAAALAIIEKEIEHG